MKTICIHNSTPNGIWHPHRTLSLTYFRVPSNLSPSVKTNLSTFVTSIMISPLHSAQLQIPALKFSHHYCIWIYQVPWMYFFFQPLITAFNHHDSIHTYHLGESFTLLSPIDFHSSIILIQEDSVFLVRTLYWHVDGNYSGHFIISLTLTLVD